MSGLPGRLLAVLFPLVLLLTACAPTEEGPGQGPLVLAAASLQEAMQDSADAWAAKGHARPVISFASSSALARQVEQGAPADLFISANPQWMDTVEQAGLVKEGTRKVLLGNDLVLVAPAGSTAAVELSDQTSVLAALGDAPIAMGDPDSVPAGQYGKAALEKLGLWEALQDRIARSENVRAALALVERAETPLGVVYGSDAAASDKVRMIARFPDGSHPPIRYPMAQLTASTQHDTDAFAQFLRSAEAAEIFANHGFVPLDAGAP